MESFLLELLACPNCEDRPKLTQQGTFLICSKCGARYPIVDGIPHLLPEDAQFDA